MYAVPTGTHLCAYVCQCTCWMRVNVCICSILVCEEKHPEAETIPAERSCFMTLAATTAATVKPSPSSQPRFVFLSDLRFL